MNDNDPSGNGKAGMRSSSLWFALRQTRHSVRMAALTRFVLSHKRLVAACWLLATVVAVASVSSAVGALSDEGSVPGEGAETSQAILQTYGNGGQVPPLVPVVTLPDGTTVDSPGIGDELAKLFTDIQSAAPNARIASYASTGDRAFVSEDGRTTFGLVFIPLGAGFAEAPETAAVRQALAGATVAGAPVHLTGYSELEAGGTNEDGGGALVETLIAAGGALVVLAWVFGSFLALVPLLVAAVAILTTLLAIWGVTFVVHVSTIVEFIVPLIGLGVAIDYALLIVTRWREEREAGLDNDAAVQRTMETAGSAVVFSGITVGVSLVALVVLPVPFLRSIGYAGMLIPLISVLVAITLLPVLLATVGPRLDWPRLRRGTQESRAWSAWARLVVRRRWIAAGVALVILAALVVPALSLTVGDPRADSLSRGGDAYDGLVALERVGIGAGVLLPFEVLARQSDPGTVAAALGQAQDVRAAVAPGGNAWRKDDGAVILVLPAVDGNSAAGRDTLDRVRAAASELPGTVQVGGPAALNADFIDAVYGNFPLLVGLVALVTFVLLVRAFRSLLLPLKAVVLNVLSVGAAYGVLVLVWQDGYGAKLIWDYTATGSITPFIPLTVFAFLFGLSMDYEVFILARMREEYDATGSTDEAIVRGIGFTGRLVTSAALILFLAFAALGSGPVVPLKILATGLAAGILLDATVIRALLVPATVSLFGHWNWWLPSWLNRFAMGTEIQHGSSLTPIAGRENEAPSSSASL
jgi:RND superfamily putative drug exporter